MRYVFIACLLFVTSAAFAAAPYVNSAYIKEHFKTITKNDMDLLRSKKILFTSRSFGLNLRAGFMHLEKENPMYAFLDSYQRFDVFKAGGDVSVIPSDVFDSTRFVHFLATYWPHSARLNEVEKLLRDPPHEFHKQADIVIVYYHTAQEKLFDTYAAKMDAMREAYPHITFIYVCAGYMAEKQEKSNVQAHAFNQKVLARYKGKVPLYDLGAILSDDGRVGQVYCPEYSKDPAGVHPNLPAGESMMAKGMLLVLRDALLQGPRRIILDKKRADEEGAETLANDHPEYVAVRAILDANNLTEKKVESVSVVDDGHIIGLYLQEGGIIRLTDEIGELKRLRLLHLYGDRSLNLPLLQSISPNIARCKRLEELLLNQNDLRSLPDEIRKLKKLKVLSLADNHLTELKGSVLRWAERYDPEGLKDQAAADTANGQETDTD